MLKLATLRSRHPEPRAVLVFADAVAARCARTGWLGEAARTFGIDAVVVDLPAGVHAAVQETQNRQRMVNPTDLT